MLTMRGTPSIQNKSVAIEDFVSDFYHKLKCHSYKPVLLHWSSKTLNLHFTGGKFCPITRQKCKMTQYKENGIDHVQNYHKLHEKEQKCEKWLYLHLFNLEWFPSTAFILDNNFRTSNYIMQQDQNRSKHMQKPHGPVETNDTIVTFDTLLYRQRHRGQSCQKR